jgi:nucleotide-binding universal stress UspA family protein
MSAFRLARELETTVQAVGVYDPYLHYTLFNGIVTTLTKEAESVFKFKDQEKLHEEIIDTGLAKIYQAHLEVARQLAEEAGIDLQVTLLDGKAFEKILQLVRRTRPWLLVMGRIGVHSDDTMDIGSTAENLLRMAPCNVLLASRKHIPAVDIRAEESVQWTPEAKEKMQRVPAFVRGVATTAILRWAIEHGHSVITIKVIHGAMGDLLPPSAAQAMGYVAEEVAIERDNLGDGNTYLCGHCGYAARDHLPVSCPVCNAKGSAFERINREVLESLGKLEEGALEPDKTFDGKSLVWTAQAKEILRRVPSGYQRRRSKARIEKTARVRGFETVTRDLALDVVEQDLAETSYLTPRGEALKIAVEQSEHPDDQIARPRTESPLPWTDAAWKRICRVPEGFMRDMTRDKVEQFANQKQASSVNLALCEEGIAEGRRMMAQMLGDYKAGGMRQEAARRAAVTSQPSTDESSTAQPTTPEPAWTEEAKQVVEAAAERVAEAGKFKRDRAEALGRGVAEQRATERNMSAIGQAFMNKLGKQLGYGHPLSELTAEYQFTWTEAALDRLKTVPEFCREMSKWRVEWTAVKKNLGRVITPEIMDVKFGMWGEVSDEIMEGGGLAMEWAPETRARLEKIPSFVRGQVIQSVEGNARRWNVSKVDNDVLDRVIQKWIETGDFHEAEFGYKAKRPEEPATPATGPET